MAPLHNCYLQYFLLYVNAAAHISLEAASFVSGAAQPEDGREAVNTAPFRRDNGRGDYW